MKRRSTFSACAVAALAGAALLAGGATSARPTGVHAPFATALRSWEGVSETATAPPYPAAAVGPTSYLELAGTQFAVYDRTHDGAVASGDLSQLLPDSPPAGHGGVLSEPQALWDPTTSRFYYSFLDLAPPPFSGDGTNYVVFGFSKDASPAQASDFCRYELDFDAYKHIDPLPAGDAFYPDALHMGDTPHNVLFGVDVYDWNLTPGAGSTNGYWGSDVDSVAKPPAGTTCPDLSASTDTHLGIEDPAGDAMRSPVPAVQVDSQFTDKTGAHALPGWIVASKPVGSGPASSLSAIKVTETASGLPNLAASVAIPVASYAVPALAPQPGGSSLDTRDGPFLTQAVAAIDPARGANVQAVWTQHTVAGGAGAQVRWYELNPAAKSVFQTGSVADQSLSVFNGAIAPDRLVNGATAKFGSDMALAVTTSSAAFPPAIQWVSKEGTGAQTGLTLLTQSPDPASGLGCESAVCAFGPTAAASADPGADADAATGEVWLTNEWTSGTGDDHTANWRTQNAALRVPLSAPVISSLSPAAGPVGSQVAINGSRFLGITSVQLGGLDMTPFTVTPTKVTATVPAGATTGQIAVTNEGGTATSPFKVTPKITGFSPNPARIAGLVTVTGTNLDEVTAFRIGTVPATLATTSSTQGTFTVPDTAVTGRLTITTLAGSFTTPASLVIAPTIGTPFAPDHAQVGTQVTIPGATFGGVNAVKFTGHAGGAPSVTASLTFIGGVLKATVPAAAVSGPVSVTTASGGTTISDGSFVVDPRLTSLSPLVGPVDSTLTINGSGFDSTSVVTFTSYGGTIDAGPPLAGSTANALKIQVPEGASTGPVVVHTIASSLPVTSGPFQVGPRISALSQTPVQAGDSVQVSGFNIEGATVTLKVGTAPATVTASDLDHVTFTVPAAAISAPLTVTAANGSYTTTDLLRVRPTLNATVSPAHGVAGTTVTITGQTLSGTSAVRFAGLGGPSTVPATSFRVVSATTLTAVVPPGALTGSILVTNAGGSTGTGSFTVDPRITSFAPSSAPVGAPVTIAGSGFDLGTTATFGAGGTATAQAGTTATSLKVLVPDGAVTGPIDVVTSESLLHAVTATSFKVAPRIDMFTSPVLVGDTVSVDGLNLADAPVSVKLGSLAVTRTNASATHFEFVVPASASTGKLTMTTGTGTFTTTGNLVVTPAITGSPAPASGAAGLSVTIPGQGLNGVIAVRFAGPGGNDTVAATFGPTAGGLTATVPAGATSGPITITTTGGMVSTTDFTVLPKITSFNPSTGPAATTAVTINGSGFQPAAAVSFGGVAAGAPTSVTATQIKIKAPPGAQTGTVSVKNPDSAAVAGSAKFTPTLSITSFVPEQVEVGDTITLSGIGFSTSSKVTFGGDGTASGSVTPTTPAVFHAADRTLTVVVPTGAPGRVAVKNGATTTWSADDLVLLTLTDISPTSGPTGQDVTLTGTGFTPDDTVQIGGTDLDFDVSNGGTKLTFTVPDGKIDSNSPTFDVTVSTPDDSDHALAKQFTVNFGISSVAGQSASAGNSITIDGLFPQGDTIVAAVGGVPIDSQQLHGVTRISGVTGFGTPSGKVTWTDTSGASPVTVESKNSFNVTLVLSPSSGPTGTSVTASGVFLGQDPIVSVGGTQVSSTLNPGGQSVTFTIPDGGNGDETVVVQASDDGTQHIGAPAQTIFRVTTASPYAGPH